MKKQRRVRRRKMKGLSTEIAWVRLRGRKMGSIWMISMVVVVCIIGLLVYHRIRAAGEARRVCIELVVW
jgi:hypothetical protein